MFVQYDAMFVHFLPWGNAQVPCAGGVTMKSMKKVVIKIRNSNLEIRKGLQSREFDAR